MGRDHVGRIRHEFGLRPQERGGPPEAAQLAGEGALRWREGELRRLRQQDREVSPVSHPEAQVLSGSEGWDGMGWDGMGWDGIGARDGMVRLGRHYDASTGGGGWGWRNRYHAVE